ncbi:hypothetical protein [Saccharothrix stipae]
MSDEPKTKFEARTWKCAKNSFVLEEIGTGDKSVMAWIGAPYDGPGVDLTPKQARELSRALVRRADFLDPPERKWRDVSRTPGEVIASNLATGVAASEHVWDDSEPPMMTYARSMMVVDSFTVAALMAELEQVAPDRAKVVAERLGDAYEDGETACELLWQWQKDREQGKPIGFDPPASLPLEAGA